MHTNPIKATIIVVPPKSSVKPVVLQTITITLTFDF